MNETKKGNAYLCYCHGETDAAHAAIVDDLGGVRRFLVDCIYGEDGEQVQEIIRDLEIWDWYENGSYDVGFEIGGLEISDVVKA